MKSVHLAAVLLAISTSLHAQARAGGAPATQLVLEKPAARIGVADGDSAYLLFGARGAMRLASGGIVVMNSGTNEIRVFDARGRHVRTLGHKGEGPGEFRGLQRIGVLNGDSVIAFDVFTGRITVFGPDGKLARTNQVQPFGNSVLPRAAGFTADGRLLAHTDFDRVFTPGMTRDTLTYALFDRAGAPKDTLGRYPGAEEFILTTSGMGLRREVAFGRTSLASARGSHVVIGTNDTLRYDIFNAAGRRVQTHVGVMPPRRPVKREDVKAADDAYLEGRPAQMQEIIKRNLNEFPHRDTYPAYQDLTVGADGSIWLQTYATPGSKARQWTVYSASGKKIREVRSAWPLELLDVGADYAIGWMHDEMDVEQILLFTFAPVT
jgi:hypothetical protein